MRFQIFLGLLLALSSLSASRDSFGANRSLEKGTVNIRVLGEPETLDWNKAHTSVETYVLMNLMDGLVRFDADMNPVPALAERWELSADGRTYTFHLRTDVKWSDGVALNAADFVYSWKRLLSPATGASYAYYLFDVQGAEAFNQGKIKDFKAVGIRALNSHTFQVRLSHPVSHWISLPTFWVTFPLRQDVVEKYGSMTSSGWAVPGKMLTLGPFSLASHEHDNKIVLKANPNYYAQHGNVDTIQFRIIKDDSTALTLYEAGKLDFLTDISTLDLKRLAGRQDLKSFPYYKTVYMGFVVDRAPWNNVHFRRAVAMAIDKSDIGKVLHGGQQPATSWVPPRMMGHSDHLGFAYEPARAREELKQAGPELASKPVDLVITNWEKTAILAQYIQEELKKNLGLRVELQQFDHKTFRAQIDMRAFPLYILSWGADYPDPDTFMSVFLGQVGNNRTNWKSAKYDELVLKARASQDQKMRARFYSEAQRLLLEDGAAVLPLYYEPNIALVKSRIQGLELNPLNYLLLGKVNLVGE